MIRRVSERRTDEYLGGGLVHTVISEGQNYFDRDAQAFLETPPDLLADDRSAGFSHVHKGTAWKRVGKGGLHRAGFRQGQDVTYLPVGAADVVPSIAGNTAAYGSLWPGVDVTLEVFPEGIKETLTNRGAASNSFAWDVVLRAVVLDSSGEFIDPLTGRVVGRLTAPTVEYEDGVRPGLLSIEGERVTITAEPGWKKIDPTTTTQPDATAGKDALLYSGGGADTNYGTYASFTIINGTQKGNGIIEFALGSIPAGAVVSSAYARLYQEGNANTSNVITVNPVSADWLEDQVTWNSRKTGTAWTTAGGDFDSTRSATANMVASAGWVNWTVTDIVSAWLAGTIPNYGFLFRETTGTAAGSYTSSDGATAANRPKLEINWVVPPTPASPIGTVSEPGKAYDTTTPRLSWTVDPLMTQTHYQVQVADTADNLKVDSGDVASASAYYDVPSAAGLVYGVTYKWRGKISDGTWTSYTAWQFFVCAPSAPTNFAGTANAEHARIDFTWTANAAAAGYNLYKRLDGATDWEIVNLSLLSGTSYSDSNVICGQAYEYTIASVAQNGYEGEDDGTVDVTLTFTGAWIGDSQVHLTTPPVITRPRRASRRVDIRGKHVIQDWGYGERIMDMNLSYKTRAELDAILDLFPTDTAVTYRDDLGRTFRGKLADDINDAPREVWAAVSGVLRVTLTEVTP